MGDAENFRVQLIRLLSGLEAVAEDHEEVGDTDVREALSEAVFRGFLRPVEGYHPPTELAMFSPEGNAKVRAVISDFLKAVEPFVGRPGLETPEARLAAFQDGDAESPEGMYYDDFFGHADSV